MGSSSKTVYILTLVSNLVSFLAGTVLSWSSPMITKLQSEESPLDRIITNTEKDWIGSLPSLGGLVGPLIYGTLMQKVGRKNSVLLLAVPYFLAYVIPAFITDINWYFAARFIAGIGMSGSFMCVPTYISEIAENKRRGLLLSSSTCFILSGVLFDYVVGPLTTAAEFNIILSAFPVIFAITFAVIGVESPYYLLANGREAEAVKCLNTVRGNVDTANELKLIKENIARSQEEKGTILDIFKSKASVNALIIAICLVVFQQFSGINVILSYTATIFEEAGGTLSPETSSIVVGSVQLATSPISPLLADRLGRRKLLLSSILGGALAECVLGVYIYLKNVGNDVDSISWLPLLCLVLFITFFNAGFSSLPWVLLAEIFPTKVKAVGASSAHVMYWVTGFLLTNFFSTITENMGMGPTFWMFSVISCFAFVFMFIRLPETKGKSFQEIELQLSR
ncbi:unnamed protein product [Brassicogethes aeneus]|uniref:Major facilitator superfamily (MFS) profile domain-containing protein n=1 Tax=Brassicogethes aeneus TaxID=1431903 RepID=A0A9P0B5Z2_BRAAE|nr:unnamed protein product [Brassicogethes aeneus]